MTNQAITTISAAVQAMSTPVVRRHDITFQLRLTGWNNRPLDEGSSYGKALLETDEKVYTALRNEIANWRYHDHDGIEGERLEYCQPEFGYDEALEDGSTLYDITVFDSTELPLMRADATEQRPISVQQLIEEIPSILLREYGAAGMNLELRKVSFYKHYESNQTGTYTFA